MKQYHLIVLAVCAVVLAGAFVLQADANRVTFLGLDVPGQCMLYKIFGIKCAFCGMTRSFCMCAKGDFGQASMLHHLGPALFSFLLIQIPYRIAALTRINEINSRKFEKYNLAAGAAICFAVIINWFVYIGGTLL